jgi:hypothetical protein
MNWQSQSKWPECRQLSPLYWFGDIVYLKTRGEKLQGMVTGLQIRPDSRYIYQVTWGHGTESAHYEIELTHEFVPEYVVGQADTN